MHNVCVCTHCVYTCTVCRVLYKVFCQRGETDITTEREIPSVSSPPINLCIYSHLSTCLQLCHNPDKNVM